MATQEREHSTAHSEGLGSARVNDEALLLRANGRNIQEKDGREMFTVCPHCHSQAL